MRNHRQQAFLLSFALYELVLRGLIFFAVAVLLLSLTVVLTHDSPVSRDELDVPATLGVSFTTATALAEPSTSVAGGSTTSTTTSAASSTTAATLPALAIVCPADVVVALGSSLSPTYTGGSALGSGGCTMANPIVQWADDTIALVARRHQRSPSFSDTLLNVVQQHNIAWTGANTSDSTSAAGPLHVIHALNMGADNGAIVYVFDKQLMLLDVWPMRTLAEPGSVCNTNATGSPQVVWDHGASRWLLAELALADVMLCLYVSGGADPINDGWHAFEYGIPPSSTHAQLSVWGDTYALTLDNDVAPLCVLDRTALLSWVSVNDTLPGMFCAAPLHGPLPRAAWSAVHAVSEAPPAETNSAGTGTRGVVFARAIDDEYHYGATMTPLVDAIEFEHWYAINFTTSSYFAVRYSVAVADFDVSPVSVPTPAAIMLDARRGFIAPRIVYRHLPALLPAQPQSIVIALTSASRSIQWYEMRWLPPALLVNPRWVLHQEGSVRGPDDDNATAWLPCITMDAQGSIVLAYSVSSATVYYPSLYAAVRLANDPLGGMRVPLLVCAGDLGSTLTNMNGQWSAQQSVALDPLAPARNFYVSGQVATNAGDPWASRVAHVRLQGEVVQRNWTATDACAQVVGCTQLITMVG